MSELGKITRYAPNFPVWQTLVKEPVTFMKTQVRIISKSHKLQKESFSLLEKLGSNFKVEEVSRSTFHLVWDVPEDSELFNEYHDHHCFLVFSAMLAAINIASLGLFSWHDGTEIGPIYIREESSNLVTLSVDHQQKYENIRELTQREVHDALILFGALCRESEHVIVNEYLKGVMHLCMSYYDLNFHREAFGNFYRVIEYLVTNRILGKRKLKNELNQLQQVFRDFGADEKLISEFKNIYAIRSAQVMHAQIQPEKVSFDEALMVKTFCDLLLNKYYLKIAETWRKGRANA